MQTPDLEIISAFLAGNTAGAFNQRLFCEFIVCGWATKIDERHGTEYVPKDVAANEYEGKYTVYRIVFRGCQVKRLMPEFLFVDGFPFEKLVEICIFAMLQKSVPCPLVLRVVFEKLDARCASLFRHEVLSESLSENRDSRGYFSFIPATAIFYAALLRSKSER